MTASPEPPAGGGSAALRQQATAALGTLAQVLKNSIAQHDQAVKRSAELAAAASVTSPTQPPSCHLFVNEPGQAPRLILVRGAPPPPDPASALSYSTFAAGLTQRNEQLLQKARHALDPPPDSTD